MTCSDKLGSSCDGNVLIPCPQQSLMPDDLMWKTTRATIFIVYLRPWTLAKRVATGDGPYMEDLVALKVLKYMVMEAFWLDYMAKQGFWPHRCYSF